MTRDVNQVVWTIAGFDPSSGAGITADLMTFAAHGLFGCSAITAYTVQSTLGVAAVEPVRPELLRQTLKHLAADLPPSGVKAGMLGAPEVARILGRFVHDLRTNLAIPVVFDPVLRASSGRELYPTADLDVLHGELLPQVDWVTPNWAELAVLAEAEVSSLQQAEEAGRKLLARHANLNLAVTGGDQAEPTDLVLTREGQEFLLTGERVATNATHGTGCAFSSALLCHLVLGEAPESAVRAAKEYVTGALRHAPGVGHGKGPMGLLWPLDRR